MKVLIIIGVVVAIALVVALSPFLTLLGLAYLIFVYPKELKYKHELDLKKLDKNEQSSRKLNKTVRKFKFPSFNDISASLLPKDGTTRGLPS